MANSIALVTKYVGELDSVYQYASKTAVLDTPASMLRATDQANAVKFMKLSLQGPGDYSRNTGYASGDATVTWETHTLSQDRGRSFTIDAMDNDETMGLTFGAVAGEYVRVYDVKDTDAYRFATYATNAIDNSHAATASLTTGAGIVAALRVASEAMDNAEVPMEGRILFWTTTLDGLVADLATTASREVLAKFSQRIIVPQSRFYTAITQYDGTTDGEEAGGYIKNEATGKNINFLVAHPSCIALQAIKHNVTKVIRPEDNQTSDGWKVFFRKYHDAFVYENRQAGLYCHYSTT